MQAASVTNMDIRAINPDAACAIEVTGIGTESSFESCLASGGRHALIVCDGSSPLFHRFPQHPSRKTCSCVSSQGVLFSGAQRAQCCSKQLETL